MAFIDNILQLSCQLNELGFKCYTPAEQEKDISRSELGEERFGVIKGNFIYAHLEKIRNADAVLIANYSKNGIEGYVGPNSLVELAFGYALEKKLYLLFEMGEQACKPEIIGMQPTVLFGDIANL